MVRSVMQVMMPRDYLGRFGAFDIETANAGCQIKTGLPLYGDGLQGYATIAATNKNIGTEARGECRFCRCTCITAGKRARSGCRLKYLPYDTASPGEANINAKLTDIACVGLGMPVKACKAARNGLARHDNHTRSACNIAGERSGPNCSLSDGRTGRHQSGDAPPTALIVTEHSGPKWCLVRTKE